MNRRGFLAGLLAAAAAPAVIAAMPKQRMAYMVFPNVDLSTFGETMVPAFEFELTSSYTRDIFGVERYWRRRNKPIEDALEMEDI